MIKHEYKMLPFKIINPLERDDWDNLLLTNEQYSFFHSSFWARVLTESYGYKPLYLTFFNQSKLSCLLPLMEIKSPLTGKRCVSLPFSDYVCPMIKNKNQFNNIFRMIITHGKKAGWKYIEFRGNLPEKVIPCNYYYIHTLKLSEDKNKILKKFRSSTRRNIRKAVRNKVEVKIYQTAESINHYYHLHCITRKCHGMPPQPYIFFKKIFQHIISKNHGFVVLAHYKNKAIAGAVYFHIGDKALYKYGASDPRYLNLRANNLVMWKAIKWYCQNNYKSFCFGRTSPENKGLIQFKSGWGTTQKTIEYYRYNLKNESFISCNSRKYHLSAKVFHKMPVPVLQIIGSLFYKHIA